MSFLSLTAACSQALFLHHQNETNPNFPPPRRKLSIIKTQTLNYHNATCPQTSSVARHCRHGRLREAAVEFNRLRTAGVEPDHITFVTLFSGCSDFPSQALVFGAALHGLVHKLGIDKSNVKVGSAIVNMYCKCGRVDLARFCFDLMGMKNKVCYNTMISGYMRDGKIDCALQLFDEMPERDVISYTALIDGFVKKGQFELALDWFRKMQLSGFVPDYVVIVSVLSACANIGAIGLGMWVNRFVLGNGLTHNVRVNNSLIDMYSRCGCIEFARQIFHSMRERNLVSWNSIIVGLALNGNPGGEALQYFDQMQKDGLKPDGVSFTGVLSACSYSGLVDQGLKLFDTMERVYRISPRIEHYGCIVDLYGRVGMLDSALKIIESMPMNPNEVVLGSVLAACRSAGNITLAEKVMKFIGDLDPDGDSNYVLLSNIYAQGGDWQKASSVRKKMKNRGIEKNPGVSVIEIDGMIDKFVAGDQSHVKSEQIYAMLEHLSHELRISGYIQEITVSEQYEYD